MAKAECEVASPLLSGVVHDGAQRPAEPTSDVVLLGLVDDVLPVLPPYEFTLYLLLLRHSQLIDNRRVATLGKRTILAALGKGTRSSNGNYQHITEKLGNLARLGFIEVGETTREGTVYAVRLPMEIELVQEFIRSRPPMSEGPEGNYFVDPALRLTLFERDHWRCSYCGELLTEATATLDHRVPRARGGNDHPENLTTCCMMCNAIKGDRTYEEAAAQLLERVANLRKSGPV